jgi:hypothetical protein
MRSHCCVCLCIPPPLLLVGNVSVKALIVARQRLCKRTLIVARQRLFKNPRIVARQRLGRNVTTLTNINATIEELLDAFLTWLVSYQRK